jgi:hypothetical protein
MPNAGILTQGFAITSPAGNAQIAKRLQQIVLAHHTYDVRVPGCSVWYRSAEQELATTRREESGIPMS